MKGTPASVVVRHHGKARASPPRKSVVFRGPHPSRLATLDADLLFFGEKQQSPNAMLRFTLEGTIPMRRRSRAQTLAQVGMVFAAIACALPKAASAEEKNACVDAYGQAQDLKDHGRFRAAREKIQRCASADCKDWMVADCTRWLDEVERRQPTIVLAAESTKGAPVAIAKVEDKGGKLGVSGELSGLATAVDPGSYELTFTAKDGRTVAVTKLVTEGQKDILIKAVFEDPADKTASTGVASAATTTSGGAPSRDGGTSDGRGFPAWIGWTTLGVGAVGGGIGGYLFASGQSDKSSAHCGVTCPGTASQYNAGNHKSELGLGLLIGGSAVLVGGVVLVLATPSRASKTTEPRAELHVLPGGLSLTGSF